MVKVIIVQTLEFDESYLLDLINSDRNFDDLDEYEKFEDIPIEELEIWISENNDLIREEMDETDHAILNIIIENDDNNQNVYL